MLPDESFKLVNMQTVGMERYGYELGLRNVECLECAEKAGLFNQNDIAGVDDCLANEVKALHGTRQRKHVFKLCGEAEVGEYLFDVCLAKGKVALRCTVLEQDIGFFEEQFVGYRSDIFLGKAFFGRVSAAEGDDLRVAEELKQLSDCASAYALHTLCNLHNIASICIKMLGVFLCQAYALSVDFPYLNCSFYFNLLQVYLRPCEVHWGIITKI